MSRIDELIEQLCPDGVEFKKIFEVGTVQRGKRFVKADIVESGVPCIHYGEIYTKYGISATDSFSFLEGSLANKLRTALPGDVVMASAGETIEDIGKSVAWLGDSPVVIHDACYAIRTSLDPKFLSYYFRTEQFRFGIRRRISSSKISSISTKSIENTEIPVPPLEVQREIVRVLDLFTSLEAELEAELEARRLQYEHYRDYQFEMLLADETVQKLPLGDVVERVRTGLNPRANFKLNTEDADKYYVTVRELSGLQVKITEKTDRVNDEAIRIINNRSNLKPGDILFSGTGTIGRTAIVPEGLLDWNIKEGVYALTPDASRVSSLYLTFFLMSQIARKSFERASEGGTVASVSMEKLKKITVPIPPRDVQLRLSSVIELFYRLALGVSDGLPAEITARRQQYEYYRDKLLTFKEKVA